MSPTLDAILLETKHKNDRKIVSTCGISSGGLVESRKGIPIKTLVSNSDFEGYVGFKIRLTVKRQWVMESNSG